MSQCPFDFLTEHEDWSEWQVDVHWRKMTPEQATQNASLRKAGWKLIGNRYGGWRLTFNKTPTNENWVIITHDLKLLEADFV